jgi:predicted esterase
MRRDNHGPARENHGPRKLFALLARRTSCAAVRAGAALATPLAALAIAIAPVALAASSRCTAYGDAPATVIGNTIPTCPGGTLLGPWQDGDASKRYACMWAPASVSTSNPLPMVVFLHPSLSTADVITVTNLIDFMNTYVLSGDAAHPGFIILAPEGRNTTHYYAPVDQTGFGWDNWYRQFQPTDGSDGLPAENVDAATIDHFIAAMVATNEVDSNRIYLTGWSNGAAMAYIYGLNRASIAAVAVYSAPDPWAFSVDPCEQHPVAHRAKNRRQIQVVAPQVPTYQVHNGCDLAGLCPNTERMERRLRHAGVLAMDQIIGSPKTPLDPGNQDPERRCIKRCGKSANGSGNNGLGAANHARWPTDWTQSMLDFFAAHPLGSP